MLWRARAQNQQQNLFKQVRNQENNCRADERRHCTGREVCRPRAARQRALDDAVLELVIIEIAVRQRPQKGNEQEPAKSRQKRIIHTRNNAANQRIAIPLVSRWLEDCPVYAAEPSD